MSVRVGLGLAAFPFSAADAFWRWVDLCEDGDVDSLWQTDRLVSPRPFLETLSVMAALAGRTQRLKFGMNVAVVPFRDPLVLAKQCATIDFLSQGRLLPAFGVGADTAPEWHATGRSARQRGAQADEALLLMTRLWSEERVTFQGSHYRYNNASVDPKPVQQPLPLWIGGSSRAAIRRTATIGSGWLAGILPPSQVGAVVEAIKRESAALGRSIDADHYGASFAFRFGSWDDPAIERAAADLAQRSPPLPPRQYLAVGGRSEIRARIDEYTAAGISKFVLRPIAEGDADVLSQTQRLIDKVLPEVHGDGA